MSVSYFIQGIIPADEKFKKMKALYDQCVELNINVPMAVEFFFNGNEPSEEGITIELPKDSIIQHSSDHGESYVVDLRKIPENVKLISFSVCC